MLKFCRYGFMIALFCLVAMTFISAPADAQSDYSVLERQLAEKRAALDDELASPAPDKGRIQSLSRDIGDLEGRMLSSDVTNGNRQARRAPGYDYPMDRNYDRGYRGGWHHGRGHHRGGYCGG